MSAVNIASELPTNLNTVEKIAAWAGLALARCNPSTKVLENPNLPSERVALTALIKADDGSNRLVIRLSLPVDDNYPISTKKFWENVTEISETVLPAAFKTN